MTLFDKDKHSEDRGNPMPYGVDSLPRENIMAKGTISTSYSTVVSSVTNARLQMLNNQLLAIDSTNTPIGLFGFDSTGAMVVKTSKPGNDVRTTTNDNLVFNSNQDTFKVANILTGSFDMSFNTATSGVAGTFTASSVNQFSQPHNLGITPSVQVYVFNPNDSTYRPISDGSMIRQPFIGSNGFAIDVFALYYWGVTVSNTTVTVKGIVSGGGSNAGGGYTVSGIDYGTFNIKVYCLQETAN